MLNKIVNEIVINSLSKNFDKGYFISFDNKRPKA